MSSRDWSHIGSVMVRAIGGKITHHNSLTDAVKSVGIVHVLRLSRGYLGFSWDPHYTAYSNNPPTGGDHYLFTDELGMVIPPWKVKEHALSLPAETWVRR